MERLMVNVFSLNARSEFFDLVYGGMSIVVAARRVGARHGIGRNWWAHSGQAMTMDRGPSGVFGSGAFPEGPGGRALSMDERG